MTDEAAATSSPQAAKAILPTMMLALALFVPEVVGGMYRGLGRELPVALRLLGSLFFLVSLAAWFWSYCRVHHLSWIMDMGWFVIMAWPVVIPYHIISREGWRGLGRIGLFLFAYFAAWAMGLATSIWARLLLGAG